MTNVVIVGSTQEKLSEVQVEAAELLIGALLTLFLSPYITVGSGGATGIDTMVEQFCRTMDLSFRKFPPKNPRWEPEGYKERNEQMAQWGDTVIRVAAKESKTFGSGWTAERARQLGKEVFEFWV